MKPLQKYISETVQLKSEAEVSIIIPAYNEEKRIVPVLEEIKVLIADRNLNWEVIVAVEAPV